MNEPTVPLDGIDLMSKLSDLQRFGPFGDTMQPREDGNYVRWSEVVAALQSCLPPVKRPSRP